MKRGKLFGMLAGVLVVGYIGILASGVLDNKSQDDSSGDSIASSGVLDPLGRKFLPNGRVLIGGVERDLTDVSLVSLPTQEREYPKKRQGAPSRVSIRKNAQVTQVAESLLQKKNPEQCTSLVVPHSFDLEAFEHRRAKYSLEYAQRVEPGRVFAAKQPVEGSVSISSVGSRHHRVIQGQSVRLLARAVPDAPVTFTSFGFGYFSNELTSTTVVANAEGVASATFTAGGGTKGRVKVLAASPLTTDQVEFAVSVKLP